jgi:hypothetical protein
MVFAHTDNISRAKKTAMIAITTILALAACNSPLPELKVEDDVSPRNLSAEAPMIVIATIISNTQMDRETSWHPKGASTSYSEETKRYETPNYPLQLFKVKIEVENVLRGNIKKSQLDIYYYTHLGPIGGVPGIGLYGYGGRWHIGDREVFYFKQVGGVFRTACDFYDSCVTQVFSGAHPDFRFDSTKAMSDSIVDLLLTRGEGSTDQGMVEAVMSRSPEHVSHDQAIHKWLELAQYDKSLSVRNAACSQLMKEELVCPVHE